MNPVILSDLSDMYQSKIIVWEKLYGKRVLVTGAYGMLASYMVYMLLYLNQFHHAKIDIYALGRDHNRFVNRYGKLLEDPNFHIVQQSVNDPINCLPPMDYIVHAASMASPHFYGSTPVDVMLPNILGTNQLLKKASADGLSGFLFFSSGVYGNLEGTVDSIRETDMGPMDPLELQNCYFESKRCGEALCMSYHVQYGVPIVCVRPSHTYGPTLDLNDSRVFANFVSDAVHGRNIVIKGDGRAERSFCYASDAALAYFKVLLDAPRGEAYNVGNDDTNISVANLAELIVRLCPEKDLHVLYAGRKKDDHYVTSTIVRAPLLNTEKIRALGWKWSVMLEEGFSRTIRSFKS